MKFILLLIPFIFYAQTKVRQQPFLSISPVYYKPTSDNFKKVYGSHIFSLGAELGIPITNTDYYFYGKFMHFKTSGVPFRYSITIENNNITRDVTQEGHIDLTMFSYNIGLLKNFTISKTINIQSSGGIQIINAKERSKSFKSNEKSLNAIFVGFGFENRFANSKFAFFLNVNYNASIRFFDDSKYSSLDLNSGFRLYL